MSWNEREIFGMNECLVVKGRMNIDEMCLWEPQKRAHTWTVINSCLSSDGVV